MSLCYLILVLLCHAWQSQRLRPGGPVSSKSHWALSLPGWEGAEEMWDFPGEGPKDARVLPSLVGQASALQRVSQSWSVQEDIAKLLRYESSALPAGQLTSLTDYASRMQAGTRNIYYLCAPNRHLAEHSPYYEAMKQKHTEVGEPAALLEGAERCVS